MLDGVADAYYQFRKNTDFVAAKSFNTGGGSRTQFRFELLNLTNTPKFSTASTNINKALVRPSQRPAWIFAHLADHEPLHLLA